MWLSRSHCFFPTYSTFEFGPCCLDQHSNLALQQISCKSVLDWSSVQYSSNLARASGVARRLATQQIGGVSGRPCSLAEMAIPGLAIVFARRHATTQRRCDSMLPLVVEQRVTLATVWADAEAQGSRRSYWAKRSLPSTGLHELAAQ